MGKFVTKERRSKMEFKGKYLPMQKEECVKGRPT